MKIQTVLWSLGIAIATCSSLALAQPQPTLRDLAGIQTCGGTVYDWPKSKDAAPVEKGDASVEVAGDGHGNWTKGTATTRPAGSKENSCELSLVKGTYSYDSKSNTYESDIDWKVSRGNSAACTEFLSYFSGTTSSKLTTMTSRVIVYVDGQKVGYQFGHGPSGFAVGRCELRSP